MAWRTTVPWKPSPFGNPSFSPRKDDPHCPLHPMKTPQRPPKICQLLWRQIISHLEVQSRWWSIGLNLSLAAILPCEWQHPSCEPPSAPGWIHNPYGRGHWQCCAIAKMWQTICRQLIEHAQNRQLENCSTHILGGHLIVVGSTLLDP